jgi:hypothetical protein
VYLYRAKLFQKGALRRVVGDKDSVQQILGVLLGLNI